jgi:hypothetical protein
MSCRALAQSSGAPRSYSTGWKEAVQKLTSRIGGRFSLPLLVSEPKSSQWPPGRGLCTARSPPRSDLDGLDPFGDFKCATPGARGSRAAVITSGRETRFRAIWY